MTDMNTAPDAGVAPAQGDEGSEITVCISMNTATGEFKVGLQPPPGAPDADDTAGAGGDGSAEPGEGSPEEEAQDADSYMQPARDMADALRQAKKLLEQPQSADGGADPFQSGFDKARGVPLGGGGM